jgi:hypothetical protein
MASAETAIRPEDRLAASAAKIAAPFTLDPTLCLYSPQDNVDAFEHPRVAEHHRWLREEWTPPTGAPRVTLLLPCTAAKPYPVSPEHRAINTALLGAGWHPATDDGAPPPELLDVLGPDEDPRLLHTGVLARDGVLLERVVVSEPLALVPYERMYDPACAATDYDDPGLFEWRGTSVAPWRDDCTAVPHDDGTWSWGPAEHDAYAQAHDRLCEVIVEVLTPVAAQDLATLAWLPAGLTHRSFLGDDASRRAEGLPVEPIGVDGPRRLVGVGDRAPGLVELPPASDDPGELVARLDRIVAAR